MKKPGEEPELSMFNEGMLQIQRLSFLWIEANNHSKAGDLDSWRWTLDTIWRELSRDADKEQVINKSEMITTLGPLMVVAKTDASKFDDDKMKVYNKAKNLLYTKLGDYDMFLRKLQDSAGKGAKYRKPDEDDFD